MIRGIPPLVLGFLLTVTTAAGQQMPALDSAAELARPSLRPYWHVFIAYAVAIVLLMVWAGSIAKRLGEVESRLSE